MGGRNRAREARTTPTTDRKPLAHAGCRGLRNLHRLDIEPDQGTNLVLGPNGAGKTSLLEAIYLGATTRSFRTARLAECVADGETELIVRLESDQEGRRRLAVAWSEERGLERTVNGNQTSVLEHLDVLSPVLWWSGYEDVLTGGPAERRKFLDRGIAAVRPAAVAAFGRYRRALDQKRTLLAQRGRGLAAWNEVLAEAAAAVIALRQRHVAGLNERLVEVVAETGTPRGGAELVYRPSPPEGAEGAAALRRALQERMLQEREAGIPLVGPHRDELEIRWEGRASGLGVSAGERKWLALALTIALARQVRRADRPALLLLDDADAELDGARIALLTAVLEAESVQSVVTSSRPAVWDGLLGARRWRLSGGLLEEA